MTFLSTNVTAVTPFPVSEPLAISDGFGKTPGAESRLVMPEVGSRWK